MNSFIYNNNDTIFTRDPSQGVEFNEATLVQNMAFKFKKNRQNNEKRGQQ